MMGGQASAARRQPARPYAKEDAAGKSAASQKFDALFGGPAPAKAEENPKDELESMLADSLAPTDQKAQRKHSNADTNPGASRRTESNISGNSGSNNLSALFPKNDAGPALPRKRYTKDQMLARFKQTSELDITVFDADLLVDYCDLFIGGGKKPTFTSSSKNAAIENEGDAFDDMMGEAQTSSATTNGLLPESIKSTQAIPEGALQQKSGPYQGKSGNFSKYQNQSK